MCKVIGKCLLLIFCSISADAQTFDITGPNNSGQFGSAVAVLTNGNYVVTDPFYDDGGIADVGAVYLFNGITHTVISVLRGSTTNDRVGGPQNGIVTLTNGNFLVRSPDWDNGAATDAGAVTFINGSSGLSGTISGDNSLVGGSTDDGIGSVVILSNGHYVVCSPRWDNGSAIDAGAVSWGNANSGVSGLVSSSNSLVGSATDDNVGWNGITILANGNYVVANPYWDNGTISDAGAVTWGNGGTGVSGAISYSNSLIGSTVNDRIGGGGITVLNNGNYLIASPGWTNGSSAAAGAATWANGGTGIVGIVSIANSLVGSSANNWVGFNGITVLSNGNYVVTSSRWDNGIINDVGAVTWGDGANGITGIVSNANSLVGDQANDRVGEGKGTPNPVIALSNGNYVISSPYWHSTGAVTWGSGTSGITGIVSNSNSSVYMQFADAGNIDVIPLVNGNFVVCNPNFSNNISRAGAVTWFSGSTNTAGIISTSNSFTGSKIDDQLGSGGVVALSNGNYVIISPGWDNGSAIDAGAATWGNGSINISGVPNESNSLIGKANDRVGYGGATALTNGNYTVTSPLWANGSMINAGAVTWGNGSAGVTGFVTGNNSLVGNSAGDLVGTFQGGMYSHTIPLTNGNYIVRSSSWLGPGPVPAGAITWGNGNTGISGVVSSSNSLVGSVYDNVGYFDITMLTNGNFVVNTPSWNNGSATQAGAVTWGNGNTGISGVISGSNSLIGGKVDDAVGIPGAIPLINGDYVIVSPTWDNGITADAGAITWSNGNTGITGTITSCNSFLGNATSGGLNLNFTYNTTNEYLIIGHPSDNGISVYYRNTNLSLATSMDSVSTNIAGDGEIPLISSSGCRLIAKLLANGFNPVEGAVSAKVWIEDTVPVYDGNPFVARHYEITPAVDASSSTGKVTLYFTQQELDNFNDHPLSTLNLPTNEEDLIGKANLRIGKYSGVSNNNSGLPATYAGNPSFIDPDDTDVFWNSNLNQWEISFSVTGFSGFILVTNTPALPLTLLEFNCRVVNNNGVLNWKTENEINTQSFDIERSTDGRAFVTIGNVAADGQPGIHQYNFTDFNISSLGVSVVYYRLRQKDIDNRFTYSQIVALLIDNVKNAVIFYPNPVVNQATLAITVNETEQLEGRILDNTGKTIAKHRWTLQPGNNSLTVNTGRFPAGLYYLQLKGKNTTKNIRFLKP